MKNILFVGKLLTNPSPKGLACFFLQSYKVVLDKWNLFCFIQILFNLTLMFAVHLEKTLFLHFLRSVLMTYLITLSLEKEIIILEKKSA